MLRRCIDWVTGGRQAQGRALASQSSQQTEDPAVVLTDQPQTAPIAAEEQPREQSGGEEMVRPANPESGSVVDTLRIRLRPHVHTLACDRRERVCTAVGKVRELETLEIVGAYSGDAQSFTWIRGTATRIDASYEDIPDTGASTQYVLQGSDVDCYIGFAFTRKEGDKLVRYYAADVIGPVEACSPKILDLRIEGEMVVGQTVQAVGMFVGGREGPSEYWWLRVREGKREMVSEPIAVQDEQGEVDPRLYKLTAEDEGCVLKVKCRPCNQAGEKGELITSKPSSVVLPASSEL